MIVRSYRDYMYVKRNFNQTQKKLKEKDSKAETHFAELLQMSCIPYWREKGNYKFGTRWCYYDFYLPMLRLYVEIDGLEHNTIHQQMIDIAKEKIIRNKQRHIVRITNKEVLMMDSINEDYLLKKAAIHRAKRAGKPHMAQWFLDVILKNIESNWKEVQRDVEGNIKKHSVEFDFEKPIFVFDSETGMTYEFEKFCHAKFFTGFNWSRMNEMLNGSFRYTKKNRFFLDWTKCGLETKIMMTFFHEPKDCELDECFNRAMRLND